MGIRPRAPPPTPSCPLVAATLLHTPEDRLGSAVYFALQTPSSPWGSLHAAHLGALWGRKRGGLDSITARWGGVSRARLRAGAWVGRAPHLASRPSRIPQGHMEGETFASGVSARKLFHYVSCVKIKNLRECVTQIVYYTNPVSCSFNYLTF